MAAAFSSPIVALLIGVVTEARASHEKSAMSIAAARGL
jgi:hypothetical protein